MMHCTMNDLIALRDGEGSAQAQRHLDECEACRQEFDRLHQRVAGLRALAAAVALVAAGMQLARVQGSSTASAADLEALIQQSQQLEGALRSYDPTSRVLNGRAASAVAELEDRIAVIDMGLAEAQDRSASRNEMMDLWRQRIQLMDELVRVHVTRAAYVGL
jgi:anti-sigma factor RsiW